MLVNSSAPAVIVSNLHFKLKKKEKKSYVVIPAKFSQTKYILLLDISLHFKYHKPARYIASMP